MGGAYLEEDHAVVGEEAVAHRHVLREAGHHSPYWLGVEEAHASASHALHHRLVKSVVHAEDSSAEGEGSQSTQKHDGRCENG